MKSGIVIKGLMLLSLLILRVAPAHSQEILPGRWKGEWYSYTRLSSYKMELEIKSISPLEGGLYKTGGETSERSPFAEVSGRVENGKVFLEFVGPDGYQWNFELSSRGKTLEGDGKTWGRGPFGSGWFYANLKLEKID
jgi:hypothetical protein